MDGTEFQWIRHKLSKTQKQMAELLGVSLKAVQSFEQGWRRIPGYVERQALFLLPLKIGKLRGVTPCYEIRHCSPRMREACPALEFRSGHLCWFINGTICQGKPQKSWARKMLICGKCPVFSSFKKQWGLPSVCRSLRGRKRR